MWWWISIPWWGFLQTATLSSCNLTALFPCPQHRNIHKHGNTLTNAHSVSPGVCFRRSWCRCSSDNRLWQTSRLHLRAVASPREDTNQHCHCVVAHHRMESDFYIWPHNHLQWFLVYCTTVKLTWRQRGSRFTRSSLSAWKSALHWLAHC